MNNIRNAYDDGDDRMFNLKRIKLKYEGRTVSNRHNQDLESHISIKRMGLVSR